MTDHDRALVILGNTETERRLLRHAGEHAQGCGVDLVLLDISWEVDSGVGRKASLILERATGHGCSQVFLAGYRNSAWGNTTLDRVLTEVVTAFDGPVTVMVDRERRVER